MLTEIYIEARLVDEELADQVWEAWYAGNINDGAARIAWLLIADLVSRRNRQRASLPSRINDLQKILPTKG